MRIESLAKLSVNKVLYSKQFILIPMSSKLQKKILLIRSRSYWTYLYCCQFVGVVVIHLIEVIPHPVSGILLLLLLLFFLLLFLLDNTQTKNEIK